ncbi:Ribonuclease H-like domain containing protein, partial [Parasponia andersonii]
AILKIPITVEQGNGAKWFWALSSSGNLDREEFDCGHFARQNRWEPPLAPWIKINVDAVVRAKETAGAAVARDEHGMVLALTAAPFPHPELVMAETAAMLLGLQLAQDYAWSSFVIEFDCLNLVNCWNGSADVPWSAAHILQCMRDLEPSFSNLIVSFVPR